MPEPPMPAPARPQPHGPRATRAAMGTRLAALMAAVSTFVTGCAIAPAPAPSPTPVPVPAPPPPPPAAGPAGTPIAPRVSTATSARDYRRDAAGHLYALNAERIYKGRLPPMLYAVGVLQVEVDRQGRVLSTHWMRAPRHAPEVVAEIEATVRRAAPFPVPARLGKVTYTDTWLWDKSGRFQLDTLTEGQD